jgi:hypothetical protein
MRANDLRTNLLHLNELLTLEDRRALLRETAMGSAEMVAYLTGERVPTSGRLDQIGRFFGLPAQTNLRVAPLSPDATAAARTALVRLRKRRRQSSVPLQAVNQ